MQHSESNNDANDSGNEMMVLKKGQGLKELTEKHQTRTGTPPEGNKGKKTHTHTFDRLHDTKKWKIYIHESKQKWQHTQSEQN